MFSILVLKLIQSCLIIWKLPTSSTFLSQFIGAYQEESVLKGGNQTCLEMKQGLYDNNRETVKDNDWAIRNSYLNELVNKGLKKTFLSQACVVSEYLYAFCLLCGIL